MKIIEIEIKRGWIRARANSPWPGAHEAAIMVADYKTAGPGFWKWVQGVVEEVMAKAEVRDER